MSSSLSSSGRRSFLSAVAAASTAGVLPIGLPGCATTATDKANSMNSNLREDSGNDSGIRPFHVQVPDEAITDLRRRIAATRWPPRETVNDRAQGARLDKIQALVRYWGTDYDWRKVEVQLNALPQYMTTID
jgi:hypothetical protein